MSLRTYYCHRWRDVNRKFSFHLINMSYGNWGGWKHQYITIMSCYKRIYQYLYNSILKGYKNISYICKLFLNNKQNKVGIMNLKLQTIC